MRIYTAYPKPVRDPELTQYFDEFGTFYKWHVVEDLCRDLSGYAAEAGNTDIERVGGCCKFHFSFF